VKFSISTQNVNPLPPLHFTYFISLSTGDDEYRITTSRDECAPEVRGYHFSSSASHPCPWFHHSV